MDGSPPRSIYKLSYDEPANETVSKPKGALWRSLGWTSEQYYVRLNEIGASASYHVEIEVPQELEINAIGVVGKRYRWYDDLENRKNSDYLIQQIKIATEGKVYIPEPIPGRRVGLAWVKLRARRSGFLAGALATSLITTIMLALAAVAAPYVVQVGKSESGTAALLLVPALVTAFIVRPGEHAITAKMLRWARIALVLNAMLPALAVFFLITAHSETDPNNTVANLSLGPIGFTVVVAKRVTNAGHELQLYWAILAVASFLFTLLFALSYILPLPYGETVYKPMSE